MAMIALQPMLTRQHALPKLQATYRSGSVSTWTQ